MYNASLNTAQVSTESITLLDYAKIMSIINVFLKKTVNKKNTPFFWKRSREIYIIVKFVSAIYLT